MASHPTVICFGNALSVVLLLQGFDEFMNLTMDDAEEVYVKENKRRQVGECDVLIILAASIHVHSLFPSTSEMHAIYSILVVCIHVQRHMIM